VEEQEIEILAETDVYSIWRMTEPEGDLTYHMELGNVTFHFFEDEWEQFVALVAQLGIS